MTHDRPEEGDTDTVELRRRQRGELRHAMSEILPDEVRLRKRSQTMANVKEHAYSRLQEELSKAQEVRKVQRTTVIVESTDCLVHSLL